MSELRIGQGIDVHPFVEGRPLILGGIRIPHARGLEGHSDADVVLHAVIDAVLGAAGLEDIGALFPDTDMQWKGADSSMMLEKAWAGVSALGWRVLNLDITVLAEEPRIAPYRSEMRQKISGLLGIDVGACGLKATTTEQLGFVGRREGILASCVILLQR